MYRADAPKDKLRMPDFFGGVPALDVPQYWHRAAGFDDTFIAHAESRQRVKFATEQDAAFATTGHIIMPSVKNSVLCFISLFMGKYIKKRPCIKVKKIFDFIFFYLMLDKCFSFVYILGV